MKPPDATGDVAHEGTSMINGNGNFLPWLEKN
jgi:hypothetical protein